MNPANKQYLTFSAILAGLLSFLINFVFVDFIKGTFLFGFPFNLNEVEGFVNFLYRTFNTLIIGAFLIIPIFYILRELERKR